MTRRQKSMRQIIVKTALVDNLSHDGKGVARIDGKVTFIQGALPGELVEFQYLSHKKDYDEAQVLSVLKSSALRVEPKCEHYQLCGGCSLQHLHEDAQIFFKEQHLLDLIYRYGHTKPKTVLKALVGPHWNYRNKARLSVRFVDKKQSALVGFRERNQPRYITQITRCPILNARVDADILVLRNLINNLDDKSCIAQIEVAATDKEIALIFRNLRQLKPEDENKLKEFGQRYQYKLFLQPGGPESIFCFYPPYASEYLTYRLSTYDLNFAFHPNDFTQINMILNEAMVCQALELMELSANDTVIDLFCGLGNFTLPMSKFCAKVIGVEGSKEMVGRAYMNAKANNNSNVEFITANLDAFDSLAGFKKYKANKLLMDPPRSGAFEMLKQIHLISPTRIVYVSCNPVTLARDIDLLVNQNGYRLDCVGVMDMFPHTTHVESIALFIKE